MLKKYSEEDRRKAISVVEEHFNIKLEQVGRRKKHLKDKSGLSYWIIGCGEHDWLGVSSEMVNYEKNQIQKGKLIIAKKKQNNTDIYYGALIKFTENISALSVDKREGYKFHIKEFKGHLIINEIPSLALKKIRSVFYASDPFEDISRCLDEYKTLSKTDRETFVKSRLGQGVFRQRVINLWKTCSVTNVSNPSFLKASHIKPWKDSSNSERLNPYNGLLLMPNLDILFDGGYISFQDDGEIIISNLLDNSDSKLLNIFHHMKLRKVPSITKEFLAYHRKNILMI